MKSFADFKQMRVAAADHQRQRRKLDRRSALDHGVDVAFDVIHGDQRQAAREAERLGVGDADQQRSHQSGTLR